MLQTSLTAWLKKIMKTFLIIKGRRFMTWNYEDSKGYISYAPSVAGLKALRELVESYPDQAYPALKNFLLNGTTSHPLVVAIDAGKLWDKIESIPIRHSLSVLIRTARKAVGELVITG